MVELSRDLIRLDLLYTHQGLGLEKISPLLQMRDFGYYYIHRFLNNLKHSLGDFAGSQIADYTVKNRSKLDWLIKHPQLHLNNIVVPIPAGMLASYTVTLEALKDLLVHTGEGLLEDIDTLITVTQNSTHMTTVGTIKMFDKAAYEVDQNKLGKLFSKASLTHMTADRVLVSKGQIQWVIKTLLDLTQGQYQKILDLKSAVVNLEQKYQNSKFLPDQKSIMAPIMMSLAYRLTLYASLTQHLQDVEHSFVKSLDCLLEATH